MDHVYVILSAPIQGQTNRPKIEGIFSSEMAACFHLDETYDAARLPADTQFVHLFGMTEAEVDSLARCQEFLGSKERLVDESIWAVQLTQFPYQFQTLIWMERWEVTTK